MVYALVLVRGTVNAVDNPTRQSFVFELVGADRLVNAISLNSVLVHSSRIIGPAIAGVLITVLGIEYCFLLNALTFGAMIVALRAMDQATLATPRPVARQPGAMRAALRYVWATPELRIPLGMMALIGTLSFNFLVLMPLLARFTFDGGPSDYAALMTAMASGSVAGALIVGARGRVTPLLLMGAAGAFGVLLLALAAAPTMAVALVACVPLGFASVTFASGVNSALQLAVEPQMRGRVMALFSMVFIGTTPIGGPLAGWIAETASPRAALVLGGAAALVGGVGGWFAYRRAARSDRADRLDRGPERVVPAEDRVSVLLAQNPR
jgi:MFS family permease